MAKTLMVICEKANAASRIATILSKGSSSPKRMGRIPYHHFTRDEDDVFIIGLRGHIVDIDFPPEFQRWSKKKLRNMVWTDPVKIITEKDIASTLGTIYEDQIKTGEVEVVVATDFDREGELIGVEGLEVLDLQRSKVSRARFSALTAGEINSAFTNLEELDRNLANSAASRREIDLLWGVILTRFLSLASKRTGKEFLSVGRVQTPTLSLIDKREREIKAFIPEPYWVIPGIFSLDGVQFKTNHVEDPFKVKVEAEVRFNKVDGATQGSVVHITTEKKEERPPSPFDTTSFLRAATKLGMQAARAMSVAEELYNRGLISYPRTDNTVYPKSLSLEGIVRSLLETDYSDLAEFVLAGAMRPTRGKKMTTDHPPIHPVSVPKKGELTKDHWKVYDLVVRRFLATLSPPAIAETSDVRVDVNYESFAGKGYRTLDPGWRRVYPFIKINEIELPPLFKGADVDVVSIKLEEKETKPPSRYSQGNIIAEMEKLGLGTKSTRHEILQKMYSRGYIRGMSLSPTRTGSAVVEALDRHAPEITDPKMTAELEQDMEDIANGDADKEAIVKKSRTLLETVLGTLEKNQDAIGIEIRKVLLQENVIAKCTCGGTLYIRQSRAGKRFVGCSEYPNCDNTHSLPQYGRIESEGKRCESCTAPVIKVFSKGKKPWVTCLNMGCETKAKNKPKDKK